MRRLVGRQDTGQTGQPFSRIDSMTPSAPPPAVRSARRSSEQMLACVIRRHVPPRDRSTNCSVIRFWWASMGGPRRASGSCSKRSVASGRRRSRGRLIGTAVEADAAGRVAASMLGCAAAACVRGAGTGAGIDTRRSSAMDRVGAVMTGSGTGAARRFTHVISSAAASEAGAIRASGAGRSASISTATCTASATVTASARSMWCVDIVCACGAQGPAWTPVAGASSAAGRRRPRAPHRSVPCRTGVFASAPRATCAESHFAGLRAQPSAHRTSPRFADPIAETQKPRHGPGLLVNAGVDPSTCIGTTPRNDDPAGRRCRCRSPGTAALRP